MWELNSIFTTNLSMILTVADHHVRDVQISKLEDDKEAKKADCE